MPDDKSQGRAIGAAMLGGMLIEMLSNFRLQPALAQAGDAASGAAAAPGTVGALIVASLVAMVLALFVAAVLAGRYGREFPALAWTYFGLTVAALACTLVELSHLHALRVVGDARLQAGPGGTALYASAVELARGLRQGVHLATKLLEGVNVLAFFGLLWQARVLPRALAGFGLVAALLQMSTVAQPLFGQPLDLLRLAPLALAYTAAIVWLLMRGLPAYRPPLTSSTAPVV